MLHFLNKKIRCNLTGRVNYIMRTSVALLFTNYYENQIEYDYIGGTCRKNDRGELKLHSKF